METTNKNIQEENDKGQKELIRSTTETVLLDAFATIHMDKPENFEAILDFVVEDVFETSAMESDGYFSHGDIITAFRRFIEKASE